MQTTSAFQLPMRVIQSTFNRNLCASIRGELLRTFRGSTVTTRLGATAAQEPVRDVVRRMYAGDCGAIAVAGADTTGTTPKTSARPTAASGAAVKVSQSANA